MDHLGQVDGRTGGARGLPRVDCPNSLGSSESGRPPFSFHTFGVGGVDCGSLLMGLGAQAKVVDYLRVGEVSLH